MCAGSEDSLYPTSRKKQGLHRKVVIESPIDGPKMRAFGAEPVVKFLLTGSGQDGPRVSDWQELSFLKAEEDCDDEVAEWLLGE